MNIKAYLLFDKTTASLKIKFFLEKKIKFTSLEKSNINYKQTVWSFLKQAMYDAVNSDGGTAYNARINKKTGTAYGKTGTAQVCSNCDVEPHGWFAGFIELDNGKKYTICIIIENGGKGSNIPTLAAKQIFEFIVENDI